MESIYDLLTSVEKLGKVTDLPLDDLHDEGMQLPQGEALSLEVDNLAISGIMSGKTILKETSFKIEKGEKVCITGESGSGKSTLLKTLSSLLDSYTGVIKINGIPLVNINLESYRKANRVIFNDQDIFYGTLMDNVGMQNPQVSASEIMDAIDRVGLKPLVDSLPKGYEEVITNAERMLSKTDRVRLITARAIVNKPGVILAEDLYSDLDPEVMNDLMDILISACETTTLIIASNHQEVLSKCSRTIKLESHA